MSDVYLAWALVYSYAIYRGEDRFRAGGLAPRSSKWLVDISIPQSGLPGVARLQQASRSHRGGWVERHDTLGSAVADALNHWSEEDRHLVAQDRSQL